MRALYRVADRVPELLVLAALCALGAISIWELRAVTSVMQQINHTLEPSTHAAADLQFALSREGATTRAFLLTDDPAYAAEFHQARADRRQALAQLTAAAAVPGVQEVLDQAARQLSIADRWLDGLYGGSITPAAYLVEFPHQHRRFSQVIASTATLHRRLRAQATVERARIDATERVALALELGGAAFALLAALSVVRLKHRERAARVTSERAQAEAERRRAQLESMTGRWTRLIRGFSHDLKNPLNAAQGYLFMLEKGIASPLSPPQMHAVSKCRHNVQTAIALTVDLVDLARAETADVDVQRVEVELCALVGTVVDDYRAQASAKGLAVVLDVPAVAERVQCNPARVSQILGNLVSNAVKYTSEGTITVSVGRRIDRTGRECLVVDVTDTGPGIAKEDHERIFREFERIESDRPSGAGIGLAISERLAQTLGGAITLDSEPGRGSTFTLWLPRNL